MDSSYELSQACGSTTAIIEYAGTLEDACQLSDNSYPAFWREFAAITDAF